MTYTGRKRLLISCICMFFVLVAIVMFVTPRLPNPDIWTTVVGLLGFVDWIGIYLILRPAISSEVKRFFDSFLVAGFLVASPGIVCIFWLGTSNWSNYPNLTRVNMYWGLAVMIGFFIWIKLPRRKSSH